MSHSGSSLTLMLILSAIDMLCAALVCSLVLFIVLIGSDESSLGESLSEGLGSAVFVQILAPKNGAFPYLRASTNARLRPDPLEPTLVAAKDELSDKLIGKGPVYSQVYVIPAAASQLSIGFGDNIPALAELIVNGDHLSRTILVRCDRGAGPITLRLRPQLLFTSACLSTTGTPLPLDAQYKIQVAIPKGSDIADPFGLGKRELEPVQSGAADNRFADVGQAVTIDPSIGVIEVE